MVMIRCCLILLLLPFTFSSVEISGGDYCRQDGESLMYADPDSTITISCTVDNPNTGLNILKWKIDSLDVELSHVDAIPGDEEQAVDQPEFVSTVTSSNNTLKTTTASLTFTAMSELDEVIVICLDGQNATDNCKLYIKTVPSGPVNITSPSQNYSTVHIQWSPSMDNGGDIVNYIITVSPVLSEGSCAGEYCTSDTVYYEVTELMYTTNYTFTISANNSVGMSSPDESSLTVTTPGEVPPSVAKVDVCLSYIASRTVLNITTEPCLIMVSNPATTPPITNYTISINGLPQESVDTNTLCNGYQRQVNEGTQNTVGVTVDNIVGPSMKTFSEVFYASWLRDITPQHSNTTLVISYTTAQCIDLNELNVQLTLNTGLTSAMSYAVDSNRMFILNSIEPTRPLSYTLNVVDDNGITIGNSYTGDLFTHLSTTTTTTPTSPPTDSSEDLPLAIIIGTVSGVVLILIVIVILIVIIERFCVKSKKKDVPKEEFEFRLPPSRDPTISKSDSDSTAHDYEEPTRTKYIPAVYEEVVTKM